MSIDRDPDKYTAYAGQLHPMQMVLSKELATPAPRQRLLDDIIQLETTITARSAGAALNQRERPCAQLATARRLPRVLRRQGPCSS